MNTMQKIVNLSEDGKTEEAERLTLRRINKMYRRLKRQLGKTKRGELPLFGAAAEHILQVMDQELSPKEKSIMDMYLKFLGLQERNRTK